MTGPEFAAYAVVDCTQAVVPLVPKRCAAGLEMHCPGGALSQTGAYNPSHLDISNARATECDTVHAGNLVPNAQEPLIRERLDHGFGLRFAYGPKRRKVVLGLRFPFLRTFLSGPLARFSLGL
jgi:hypothetical protein